eukprot:9238014-Karenia_brevis.AAC.1
MLSGAPVCHSEGRSSLQPGRGYFVIETFGGRGGWVSWLSSSSLSSSSSSSSPSPSSASS